MLRLACWVFLVLSTLAKPSTSGLVRNKIAKRAVCPPGGGDQEIWCSDYEEHCNEGMKYHLWMMQNCPATCGQCKAAPTTAPPPPVEQVVAVDSVDCLSAHNDKRNLHVDTPDMEWDDNLAQGSESWSLVLARDYSDPVNLTHSSGNYGENLAYFGSTGDVGKTCRDAVNSWYNEINDYDWNNPGNPVEVGKAIGHFTQVVWKSSTKVGCGAAKIKRDGWNLLFITCRYLPAGNVIGAYSTNVLALA